MTEEFRERIIAACEDAFQKAGATSYQDAVDTTIRFLSSQAKELESIRSKDDLAKVLDSMPPLSKRDERLLSLALPVLPQLIRYILRAITQKASSALPSMSLGRPQAITGKAIDELLDLVSDLHRKGVPLRIAQQRASNRYGCSPRTVARLWASRGSPSADNPTVRDLLRHISGLL